MSTQRLLCAGVLLGLLGCADPAPKPVERGIAVLTGTVWYRERIALPPGAEVHVSLQDVARQDVAATVLGETRFTPKLSPPYPFAIRYDRAMVEKRGDYTVRASIRHEDRLLFASDSHIPAFGGKPPSILVKRVPAPRPRPQKQQ